jgi:hypothetical protein
MEVHHHPDLHHRRKKWKEYFLEFLMIFLAVTLGFFAETVREKISEKHRENDYIVGLINNIKNDTSNLKGLIDRNDLELRGIDSLLKVSKTNFLNIPVQDSIFYYGLYYTFNLHLFDFNDLTLVQLRNAGGYSTIRTDKVADSIALYESKNNDIKVQERFVIDYYTQTMTSFRLMLDITLTRRFFQDYEPKKMIPSDIYVLISKDEERMSLLYNNYWIYKGSLGGYNDKLKKHLEYLNGFITFLKKTYEIE